MGNPLTRPRNCALAVAASLFAGSSGLQAAGFALIEQGVTGLGNAYAGAAASAEDATTIFFNPAGLTRVNRTQTVVATHVIIPSSKFEDQGTTNAAGAPMANGGDGGDAGQTGVVPNFYFATPFNEKVMLGIGVNVPFGLETKYDSDWAGRYHAIKSSLLTVNINPTLAYKVNNALSVGAGLNAQYIDAELTNAVDFGALCVPTATSVETSIGLPAGSISADCIPAGYVGSETNDGRAKLEGDDVSYGYNLGLLYEFGERTRVGLAYRSEIKQDLSGDVTFSNAPANLANDTVRIFVDTDITASVDLPDSASLSGYHEFSDRWAVLADVTWTNWSNFQELRIEYIDVLSNQPDSVVEEAWDDSFRYSLGTTYRYNSSWTFRGGVAFDETPIPDPEHRTPRIPGEDRTWVTVGAGWQASPDISVDLAYAHLFVEDAEINHFSSSAGTIVGEYEAEVDIISAQLTWNFN